MKSYSADEKNAILLNAFKCLKGRGITSAWSSSSQPFTDLRSECIRLMQDAQFREDLASYVRAHTTLQRAIQMFFTSISMAARAKWDEAPEQIKGVVARGWFLGRWIPTFLIIDGPIGRFMIGQDSPFKNWYGVQFPLITAAKEFLADRTFRMLRNGFAHWGFDWEVVGTDSFVIAYDWERDLPIAKLHQTEADAYHIATFALIEIIDKTMLTNEERAHAVEA
jgi:hypothetical protein